MPEEPETTLPNSRVKPWWLLGLGLAFVLLIALMTPLVLIFSALTPMCGNDHLEEMRSPGGGLKAVIFRRDCGATTGYSMNVSILPARKLLPNEAGNVLVINGDTPPVVQWVDDSHLVISRLPVEKVFAKAAAWRTVQVSYRE